MERLIDQAKRMLRRRNVEGRLAPTGAALSFNLDDGHRLMLYWTPRDGLNTMITRVPVDSLHPGSEYVDARRKR